MSEGNSSRQPLSDAQLETLLVDFFQREMPAELRLSASHAVSPRVRPAALRAVNPAPAASAGGIWALLLAGLALGLVIALAFTGGPVTAARIAFTDGGADEPANSVMLVDDEPIVAPVPVANSRVGLLPFAITDDHIESAERMQYDTPEGPVEQRLQRRIRNVSIYDPETGSKLEVTIPEVTIEIFPIEKE